MKNNDKQFLLLNIKASGEEADSRVLSFTGSDETVDRQDDVMTIDGWELENYMKNPVFLWAHNYNEPPIGKAIFVGADAQTKKLIFKIEFAKRETYAFADVIFKLFKEGFLNAVSVGFMSKERTFTEGSTVSKITKKELLELSAVPVPANPNALIMSGFSDAVKKGVINEQEWLELSKMIKDKISKGIMAGITAHAQASAPEEPPAPKVPAEPELTEDQKQLASGIQEVKDIYKDFLHPEGKGKPALLPEKDVEDIKNLFSK